MLLEVLTNAVQHCLELTANIIITPVPSLHICLTSRALAKKSFKEFVATGATDDEIAEWLKSKSKVQDKMEIIRWNYRLRDMRISEMPDGAQEYLEEYIEESVPKHRPVYVWFDVYDLEEERL